VESEPITAGGLLTFATKEILGNDVLYSINPKSAFITGEEDEWALPFDETLFLEEIELFINDMITPNIQPSSDITKNKDVLPKKQRNEEVKEEIASSNDQGDLEQDKSMFQVNTEGEVPPDNLVDKSSYIIIAELLESDLQEQETLTLFETIAASNRENFRGKTL